MEKHEMVQSTKAVEMKRRLLMIMQGGNTCGAGMAVGASGTRWLLKGPAVETGLVKSKMLDD